MNLRLSSQIFSMEIRKAFAYRSDFWISFIVSTLAQFTVAWFLWKSIFSFSNAGQIGGYTFQSLMLYYLIVPIIGRIVFGVNIGDVASEIYQGSLTRYLIYPLSFFRYKLLVNFAGASILLTQLMLVTCALVLFFPPVIASGNISAASVAAGTATTLIVTLLFFIFSSSIQLIAFWADNVWSLSAILRFITNLLGGSLIPLSMFPDSLQPLLKLLPFSCFIHMPMQTFLGNMSFTQWCHGMAVVIFWGAASAAVYAMLWRRGNFQYTGVGI